MRGFRITIFVTLLAMLLAACCPAPAPEVVVQTEVVKEEVVLTQVVKEEVVKEVTAPPGPLRRTPRLHGRSC